MFCLGNGEHHLSLNRQLAHKCLETITQCAMCWLVSFQSDRLPHIMSGSWSNGGTGDSNLTLTLADKSLSQRRNSTKATDGKSKAKANPTVAA
ncbi:hypothetical protein BaRGS_00039097 [Batillaria attramentaria]|uniref:Uncharacterized protein n=1 Tax=Batillaria attramentaria TaxID=370345 RepID=A0ABD0J464_9CAEN